MSPHDLRVAVAINTHVDHEVVAAALALARRDYGRYVRSVADWLALRSSSMLVPMAISTGSRVSWNTEQGRTQGTVVERRTSDFQLAGHQFRASEDEPMLVVESEKSGKHAAHKSSALTELKG